jgi:hypothetical protein
MMGLHIHILTFAFWFVIMCSSLIISDDMSEKFPAFIAVLPHQMRAGVHTFACVLFSQFPQNPPFTDFVESKNDIRY